MAIKGKKGFFFSLAAILLIGVIGFYFSLTTEPGYTREQSLHQERINTAEQFLQSIHIDAQTALHVSAQRSLSALDQIYLLQGEYVLASTQEELQTILENAILQGEIEGNTNQLLDVHTIEAWSERMSTTAAHLQLNFEAQITEAHIEAYQTTPWSVTFQLALPYILKDDYSQTIWNTSVNITTDVTIIGLLDPVYSAGTEGRYFTSITPATPTNTLEDFINERLFVASNQAPSYLQRLRGSTQTSDQGIVSLIDAQLLSSAQIISEGSIIDWHYLISPTTTDVCHPTSTAEWVLIDTASVELFNIGEGDCS